MLVMRHFCYVEHTKKRVTLFGSSKHNPTCLGNTKTPPAALSSDNKKAVTDNARHGEQQTPPSVSYLWAGAKKSATINDSGIRCRGTHLLANDSNFDRNPLRGCNYGLEGVHF